MADLADLANELVETTSQASIASARSSMAGKGQDYCEDCGDDLTPERRNAAPWAIRCVPCAGVFERMQGGRGRG